jgi:hypothetical protein
MGKARLRGRGCQGNLGTRLTRFSRGRTDASQYRPNPNHARRQLGAAARAGGLHAQAPRARSDRRSGLPALPRRRGCRRGWPAGRRRPHRRQRRRVPEKLLVPLRHRAARWPGISRGAERAAQAHPFGRLGLRALPRFLRRIPEWAAGQCRRRLLGRHRADQIPRPGAGAAGHRQSQRSVRQAPAGQSLPPGRRPRERAAGLARRILRH